MSRIEFIFGFDGFILIWPMSSERSAGPLVKNSRTNLLSPKAPELYSYGTTLVESNYNITEITGKKSTSASYIT